MMRALVMADEPLAQTTLATVLRARDDVESFDVASDGVEALEKLRHEAYDLLLLDINLPSISGVELLDQLRAYLRSIPSVIFVTAHQEHALTAFQRHAVDYVLKPVSRERLSAALERAHGRHAAGAAEGSGDRSALAEDVVRRPPWLERLPVRLGGQVRLVDVSTIDWIEAADNYVVVHAGRETHVLRETLAHLSASLDPALFARIHRSTVVRIDRVVRLQTTQRGDYAATLADGTTRVLSRTFRTAFEQAIGRRL